MRHALFLLALLASPALAQIEIENAWTRATPPGAKTAAGYLTIRNKSSSPDHLIRAASPLAARVEMHVHLHDGDVMRMRPVEVTLRFQRAGEMKAVFSVERIDATGVKQ